MIALVVLLAGVCLVMAGLIGALMLVVGFAIAVYSLLNWGSNDFGALDTRGAPGAQAPTDQVSAACSNLARPSSPKLAWASSSSVARWNGLPTPGLA